MSHSLIMNCFEFVHYCKFVNSEQKSERAIELMRGTFTQMTMKQIHEVLNGRLSVYGYAGLCNDPSCKMCRGKARAHLKREKKNI